MALPAIREYRLTTDPSAIVAVMTKEKLKSFWELVPYVDAILTLHDGAMGVRDAAGAMRQLRINHTICFTNSFRSALPPWWAGVKKRTGTAGHWRRGLLTDVVALDGLGDRHQSYEYARLLGMPNDRFDGVSRLIDLPCGAEQTLAALGVSFTGPFIAIIPGAARGPSKQWPAERFRDCVRRVVDHYPHHILLLGSESERTLCEYVAGDTKDRSHVLAGATSIRQLAEVLSLSQVAIVNDSGGMHLAAAVGTPVVAMYGLTDPRKTGPLGAGHEIMAAAGYERGRDIPRESEKAVEALARVTVAEVMAAVDRVLTKLTSSRVGGI